MVIRILTKGVIKYMDWEFNFKKIFMTSMAVLLAAILLCSCKGQTSEASVASDKPFLEQIVSVKNGTLEPVPVSYGMTISEVAAKLGLKEEEYDSPLNRLIGHFEHPSLTEPASLDIRFLDGKVVTLIVNVVHQKDMEAFQKELYQQTENYIPKEWLATGENAVAKKDAVTAWKDPGSNGMSIWEGSAGEDGRALAIQLSMNVEPR